VWLNPHISEKTSLQTGLILFPKPTSLVKIKNHVFFFKFHDQFRINHNLESHISDQQLQNGHFQQDSATAPTSHAIMEYQQQF
jgi:hypothetical protein